MSTAVLVLNSIRAPQYFVCSLSRWNDGGDDLGLNDEYTKGDYSQDTTPTRSTINSVVHFSNTNALLGLSAMRLAHQQCARGPQKRGDVHLCVVVSFARGNWKQKRGQVSLFWRRTLLDFPNATHETHLSGR